MRKYSQTKFTQLKLLASSLVLTAFAMPALAGHDDDRYDDEYEDQARVINVQPQTERINNPRQQCRTDYVRESYYEPQRRSNTGAVIGGVTGGLLGSTIGRGNGRVAAAAVGAGFGAIVGDRVDNNDTRYGRERTQTRPVETCTTVDNWQTVNRGYLVTYQYNGHNYTTVTDNHPGQFVPVRVAVDSGRYQNNVTNITYVQPSNQGWDDDDDNRRGRGRGHDKHRGRGHDKHERHYW